MTIGGAHDGEVTPPGLHERVPPAGRRDGHSRGTRHRRSLAPPLALSEDADQLGQACEGRGRARDRRRAPPRGDGARGRVVATAAGERRAADGARHLKKSERVLRAGVAARYQMIKELRRDYPVRLLCRVLGVSRSGYHAWLTRAPSRRALARERLKVAAQAAHQRTRQTYGARRLQHELTADGFVVSLGTVKRVRGE